MGASRERSLVSRPLIRKLNESRLGSAVAATSGLTISSWCSSAVLSSSARQLASSGWPSSSIIQIHSAPLAMAARIA